MSNSTMESTQMKVKLAVDEMIDDLDKNYLREMQKSMFQCSARFVTLKITFFTSILNFSGAVTIKKRHETQSKLA